MAKALRYGELDAEKLAAAYAPVLARLNEPRKESLQTIAGLPPDLAHLPPGCSFAPRCWLATEECWQQVPELLPTDAGRLSACFHRDGLVAGAEMPA